MKLAESMRFVATKDDMQLLAEIAKKDGDASMAATLRRLIRQEAQRRGIETQVLDNTPESLKN